MCERYEKHGSKSSSDIEKVKGKNTYYKQVFDFVCDILPVSKPVKKGKIWVSERVRTDVMESFRQARNNYFDTMIAEMNNE